MAGLQKEKAGLNPENEALQDEIASKIDYFYSSRQEAVIETYANMARVLLSLKGIGIEDAQEIIKPYLLLADILSFEV